MTAVSSGTSDTGGAAAVVSRPSGRSTEEATANKRAVWEASTMSTTMGFAQMHDASVHTLVPTRQAREL
jgi:hypothetical protein